MNQSEYKSEGLVEFSVEELKGPPDLVARIFEARLRAAGLPLDVDPAGADLSECWGNRRWRSIRFGNAVDLVGADEFALLKNDKGKVTFAWGQFGCAGSGISVTEMDAVPPSIAETALTVFKEMLSADPAAAQALISNRVPCNDALADHAHITVDLLRAKPVEVGGVGCLGLVNGILRAAGSSKIVAAIVEESGEISEFFLRDIVEPASA